MKNAQQPTQKRLRQETQIPTQTQIRLKLESCAFPKPKSFYQALSNCDTRKCTWQVARTGGHPFQSQSTDTLELTKLEWADF